MSCTCLHGHFFCRLINLPCLQVSTSSMALHCFSISPSFHLFILVQNGNKNVNVLQIQLTWKKFKYALVIQKHISESP
jgi:hypothetical protein